MSYLKQLSLFAVVVLFTSCVSQASIVMDDFTQTTEGSSLNLAGLGRNSSANATYFQNAGYLVTGNANIRYTTGSVPVSFEDLLLGPAASGKTAFSIGTSSNSAAAYTLQIFTRDLSGTETSTGAAQAVGSGFNTITESIDFAQVSRIRFRFVGSGSISVLGGIGGAFTAVPEPTSMMLVGMAVAGVLVPRRRRA